MAKGQSLVMHAINNGEQLIPVVGAPGTGKTTLFKSIISNMITNRVLSIINEERDYSILSIVTSTANKAVNNIYEDLKYENPFCGMAFFRTNKNANEKGKIVKDFYENKKSLDNLISFLREELYEEGFIEKLDINLEELKKTIEDIKEEINFSLTSFTKINSLKEYFYINKIPLDPEFSVDKEKINKYDKYISIEIDKLNKLLITKHNLDSIKKIIKDKKFEYIKKQKQKKYNKKGLFYFIKKILIYLNLFLN